MRKTFIGAVLAAGLLAAASPALALTATIKGSPPVSVEVPDGFVASNTSRGVEIKTPDEEVFVWFETYRPKDVDAVIKEHERYWKEQGVKLGDGTRTEQESDGVKVAVTDFAKATWKGTPTVVRYLFIDGNFSSGELILMSVWASPKGIKQHDDAISDMIGSLDAK